MKFLLPLCLLFTGCLSTGLTGRHSFSVFHPIKSIEHVFHKSSPASVAGSILPGSHLPSLPSINTMHNILSSSAAPVVLVHSYRWLWVLVVACVFASALAFFTSHFLAAIKFAFGAVGGAVMTYLYGVVIGSFVLSMFASFAVGLVIGWYVLNSRFHMEPNSYALSLAGRLTEAENRLSDALAKVKEKPAGVPFGVSPTP